MAIPPLLPPKDHRGNEAAGIEWAAVSHPAVWHPERRARRHGRFLRQEIALAPRPRRAQAAFQFGRLCGRCEFKQN